MLRSIKVETIPEKTGWLRLLEDYRYKDIWVPAGFEYNGASSPNTPLIRWAIPKFYMTMEAACIHDYLCGAAKNKKDRKRADKIFKEMLEEKGMGGIRRNIGYMGVRIGAFFTRYK